MKTWIKIIVAISVILVICFGVWAFFFKEKDEVIAYNRTAELIDYKQSLGIEEKFNSFKSFDYLKNDTGLKISSESESGKNINEIRRIILSDGLILGYGNNKFYSYVTLEKYIDEVIEYYLPYVNGNKVNTKALKTVKEKINNYIKTLKSLNSKLDEVINYQSVISGSAVELDILNGYYSQLQSEYRKSLNYGAEVAKAMINYIDKSVYKDNILIDTKTALYDSFIRAIIVSTSVEGKLEPDYSNDLRIIVEKISQVKSGSSIFIKYNEYSFLVAYNKLYNDYASTLDYVFSCKNLEKEKMADGMALGQVLEKVQDSVITVVNVLGY